MKLDALLRAHGFMKIERPPLLWKADTGEVPLVELVEEMIAAALVGGASPEKLTLNVSNVIVEPDPSPEPRDEGQGPPSVSSSRSPSEA